MCKRKILKSNSMPYKIGMVFTIIIEVIAYLIFIISAIGTIVSFVLSLKYFICGKYACFKSELSVFGTLATVSIIPFISIVASLIISYKNSIKEIENDLAKSQDIDLQIKKLPVGADLNSARLLQAALLEEHAVLKETVNKSNFSDKTLKDFSYLVNLNFKQDISEFYRITLCDMELVDYGFESKDNVKQSLRNIDNVEMCPCIIKDVSGVNLQNEGEQIYIFLDKELGSLNEIEKFLAGFDKKFVLKRSLRFKLNFLPKDFSCEGKILFPITKKLTFSLLDGMLRRRHVETELEYRLSESRNEYVIETQIIDVSFKIVKNLSWSKYLKYKKKILRQS